MRSYGVTGHDGKESGRPFVVVYPRNRIFRSDGVPAETQLIVQFFMSPEEARLLAAEIIVEADKAEGIAHA